MTLCGDAANSMPADGAAGAADGTAAAVTTPAERTASATAAIAVSASTCRRHTQVQGGMTLPVITPYRYSSPSRSASLASLRDPYLGVPPGDAGAGAGADAGASARARHQPCLTTAPSTSAGASAGPPNSRDFVSAR